jgi:hypothetical protein
MAETPSFSQTPLNPITPSPIPPLTHHHMSRRVFRWLIILAVALAAISAYLFFFGSSSFTESKVDLTIDGPTQASVGDEVIYKVHYENTTKTTLKNMQLSFTYPDNSIITQDGQVITDPGNVRTSNVSDLAPGQSQDLEFHGFLVGDKGNIKTAKVKLTFSAGTITSPFEKDAELSTTITDVPVQLTFVGPPNAVSGESVTYILDYRNQSQDDIPDLQLVVSYPDGFKPSKTSPNPSTGNTWTIPLLKRGDGSRITIQGTLTGNQGDSKTLGVSLRHTIDNTYVDYEKTAVTTVISSPLLNLDSTVNGSPDYISHAGDTLQYEIHYQNTSTSTFTGLVLSAKLDGTQYDLSSVDPKSGFYDSSSHTVTWNSTAVPAFASLAPRQAGTLTFSVKLKPSISGSGSSSLFVRAGIQLSTPNVPDGIVADQIAVNDDVITKITSQPVFRESAYYNDLSFGSSGPFPPQAGKDTVFTIHWQVTNPGNPLTNTKVVATLPQGVTWKGVMSTAAGLPQPSFNRNTSQVIWNLGSLPSGVGTNGQAAYELVFQVTLRPSTTQTNQAAPLINNTSLAGTDSFTGQNIVVNAQDLTTNSTVDQPGLGTVQ